MKVLVHGNHSTNENACGNLYLIDVNGFKKLFYSKIYGNIHSSTTQFMIGEQLIPSALIGS